MQFETGQDKIGKTPLFILVRKKLLTQLLQVVPAEKCSRRASGWTFGQEYSILVDQCLSCAADFTVSAHFSK